MGMSNKTKTLFTALIFALSFLSFQTSAKDLSEAVINQWLDSVVPIQAWAKSHQEKFNKVNQKKAPDMSTKGMIQSLKEAGLYDNAKTEMKKYGFSSPDEWAETQHRVIQAMMSLQMDAQPKNAFNAKEQLAKIKTNPNIPAAQKAKMVSIIESTAKMMEEAKHVPAADKSAVKPHMQTIMDRMSQAGSRSR